MIDKWGAGYAERCPSGSAGGAVKPTRETLQGALILSY